MILQYILFRGMIAVTITTVIAAADNIRRAERKRREKRRRREQCERSHSSENIRGIYPWERREWEVWQKKSMWADMESRWEREEIPIIPRDRAPLADYIDEAKLPIIFSAGVQPVSAQEAADGTRAYSAKAFSTPRRTGAFTRTVRLYADDKVIEEIEQEM